MGKHRVVNLGKRAINWTLWRVPKTANAGDGKDGMNGIFPI